MPAGFDRYRRSNQVVAGVCCANCLLDGGSEFTRGGNVGYYVRAAERGKGYATIGLRLAVAFFKSLGVDRVLVTMQPSNKISARVAVKNGGVLDTPGCSPYTGGPMLRYWIQS